MNAFTKTLVDDLDRFPEPEITPVAHPVLMVVFLIATAWAAAFGFGYAAYRALEALFA
ncbi:MULTISPECIES: hypothetical protein [unclassified Mesorhizobium]|uniref:hypothetical protein n=1 Tax=unclassified Mesorhizobium TaxID=325217 RepID=UPI0015E30FDE|nr:MULTISPECIES: hypothetical protein [unclassified Mesorhizobium]